MEIMNKLNELSKNIYEGNKLRGFDVSKENIGQTLMLVVSELAEALEADRKDKRGMLKVFERDLGYAQLSILDFEKENENFDWLKNRFETTVKDTFEDEIADSIIRLLDLCGGFEIDIEKHIECKLKYNSAREYRHSKKY
jgi:NTP pyrophosphatase (non-canonical NTP hydrolase)